MKLTVSRSVMAVILVTELLGLSGVLYLRHCFGSYTSFYESYVATSLQEREDATKIKEYLLEHEASMSAFLRYGDNQRRDEFSDKVIKSEINLRNQMIEHGRIMTRLKKDKIKYGLYRDVNDDILNYLNYNAVLNALKLSDMGSIHDYDEYIDSFILPLTERVNNTIDQLGLISQGINDNFHERMIRNIRYSKIFSVLCIVIMIAAIVFSFHYNYHAVTGLESDKESYLKKSLIAEKRLGTIQHKVIVGIADIIESRSGETGEHVKRTVKYVSLILHKAQEMGLWKDTITDEYIKLVEDAAPLHDVGKITIPDAILNKPGRLTLEEFEIMKTHAVKGGEIIRKFMKGVEDRKYTEIAYNIARYHHEKWNGTGYPEGLKGDKIPLGARIMAVADVFDALVSERCYKKAMTYDEAFDIINRDAGIHFDPLLAEVFLSLRDKVTKND